jgi:hypothetical protein
MTAAAESLAFERAAALRDKLDAIRWLSDRLAWLQRARAEQTFVYPVVGQDARTLWYLIHRGRVRTVVPVPRDAAARQAARAAIAAVFAPDGRDAGPLPADQMDHILLVAGWFRKRADERQRLLSPADALRLCRSGNALARG